MRPLIDRAPDEGAGRLKQLIVEGPNAAAVASYDYVNPVGGRFHQDDAEVSNVENGQIVSLMIYVDITEFRVQLPLTDTGQERPVNPRPRSGSRS